jgi:hypothetical protein
LSVILSKSWTQGPSREKIERWISKSGALLLYF